MSQLGFTAADSASDAVVALDASSVEEEGDSGVEDVSMAASDARSDSDSLSLADWEDVEDVERRHTLCSSIRNLSARYYCALTGFLPKSSIDDLFCSCSRLLLDAPCADLTSAPSGCRRLSHKLVQLEL